MNAARQQYRTVRASHPGKDVKEKVSETGEVFKSNVAQLLGVRGGERTSDIWKIRLQLTKPVTWVPLIWGAWSQPLTWACCTSIIYMTILIAEIHQLATGPLCSSLLV